MKKSIIAVAAYAACACCFGQSLGEIAAGAAPRSEPQKPAQAASANQESVETIIEKAKAGDASAQLALGSYCAKGLRGVKQDGPQAVDWLTRAASQNMGAAKLYLGYIYGEGKIVPRDVKKAIYWREDAAKDGTPSDKWALGNAFLYGFMLPKDQQKALFWISAAADGGEAEAVIKLVEIYKNLDNPQEFSKWNDKFAKMQLAAAENGNPDAMASVAAKYMSGGDGLERNRVQAVYWYKKAADAGNADAMEKVAMMYAKGRFLPRNPAKAQEYFEKLASKDFSYCMKISAFYSDGKDGFPKDDAKSLEWLERAAARGDVSTQLYIAWRFWIAKDLNKASRWCKTVLERASTAGKDSKTGGVVAVAKAMISDMSAGKAAPENFRDYCKTVAEM